MKMNIKNIQNILNDKINEKLSKREKQYLLAGSAFAILFILIVFIVLPLGKLNAKMERNIDIKERQLKKVYEISSRIKAIESANAHNQAARGNFTVFAYLENLAEKKNIKNKIEYMKPVTSAGKEIEAVEIRIKGVFEEDLIGFLYGIDTSPTPLKVNRFNLRKSEKDKNLDVTFQVQVNG
jgi:hypothetical protein